MPTITVTSADHRNHAIARAINTGYTFTRTPGSSAFIEGVPTKLRKYSKPIQMIPKIKCSHRSAINSLAAGSLKKLKCGFHSGNEASSHKHIASLRHIYRLQVVDVNLQIEPTTRVLKRGGAEFRRSHVAFRVIRCAHSLAGHADEIRVQLAVGVFVMHNGHGIGPRGNSGELADRLTIRDLCGQPSNSFVRLLRKCVSLRRGIQRAQH